MFKLGAEATFSGSLAVADSLITISISTAGQSWHFFWPVETFDHPHTHCPPMVSSDREGARLFVWDTFQTTELWYVPPLNISSLHLFLSLLIQLYAHCVNKALWSSQLDRGQVILKILDLEGKVKSPWPASLQCNKCIAIDINLEPIWTNTSAKMNTNSI